MNAPIPVSEALKLLSMALEDCDKAMEREWPVYEPEEGDGPEVAVFVQFSFLARATMRQLLENLKGNVEYFWPDETELIRLGYRSYPPLAALRDHYDAVRPGWRTE